MEASQRKLVLEGYEGIDQMCRQQWRLGSKSGMNRGIALGRAGYALEAANCVADEICVVEALELGRPWGQVTGGLDCCEGNGEPLRVVSR